jgi:hypothetical protein
MNVEEAEILPTTHRIEFIDLLPDWMHHPEYFDGGDPE